MKHTYIAQKVIADCYHYIIIQLVQLSLNFIFDIQGCDAVNHFESFYPNYSASHAVLYNIPP